MKLYSELPSMKLYSIFYFDEESEMLIPAMARFNFKKGYDTFEEAENVIIEKQFCGVLFTILPIYDKINF